MSHCLTRGIRISSESAKRLRALGTAMLMVAFSVAALLWSIWMSRPSVAFAFFINWALMGFAFVVWAIVPLRFGGGYYRVRAFEQSGRLYEAIGVRLFQRFLRRSGIHGPRVFPSYVRGPVGGASLVSATLGPETAHLLIFIVVGALTVDTARRGWWNTAGWLALFNVLHNAYPVLSLRYVRVRADRLFGARARISLFEEKREPTVDIEG